jgi:hypothetical protein
MSYLLKLSDKEWIQSIDNAVLLYKEFITHLDPFEENDVVETENNPMHPHLYYQLIQVNGFVELNGNDYQEYLNKWKIRTNSNN